MYPYKITRLKQDVFAAFVTTILEMLVICSDSIVHLLMDGFNISCQITGLLTEFGSCIKDCQIQRGGRIQTIHDNKRTDSGCFIRGPIVSKFSPR